MLWEQLKPNAIVRGPILPEPVQVIVTIPMGESVKLIGKGLTTGQVHEPILNAAQLAQLTATSDKEPFDGDPLKFRLRVNAHDPPGPGPGTSWLGTPGQDRALSCGGETNRGGG